MLYSKIEVKPSEKTDFSIIFDNVIDSLRAK